MSGVSRGRWLLWCASLALAIGIVLSPPAAEAAGKELSAEERQEIAVEAYLYAYPIVMMEKTRALMTNVFDPSNTMLAPMNQFAHVRVFPDDKFVLVARANADTLYSLLWYDVSKEPLIISAPDSGGRYHMLPFVDMWTDVIASPGTRTTGGGALTFAIVGPDWKGKLPAGVQAYRSPTAIGWMMGRVMNTSTADLAGVHRFQDQVTARPLSAWGKKNYVPPPAESRPLGKFVRVTQAVAEMDPADFFHLFAEVTVKNPPHAQDYPQLDRMARLGLVPGQPFDLNRLPPEVQSALRQAPAIAQRRILEAPARQGARANGWVTFNYPIGTYGTDYLRRATVAYLGIGANVVEDAVYPAAFTDSEGRPLDSAARYIMHFDKAQLPPVRAFWSVSMYNDRQFFAANPISRFALGDRDPLKFNADGSLDLYIQRAAPGADKTSNWLPAPADGKFSMNLRLYWPTAQILNGEWKPPPVKRLE